MRPSFTIAILLSILGILSYSRMPRDIDPPDVIGVERVVAYFPGTTPSKLDEMVTQPVERLLNSLGGIGEIGTRTSDGISVVNFQLDPGAKRAEVLSIVRDRLGALRSTLQLEMQFLIGPSLQVDPGQVQSGLIAVALAEGGKGERSDLRQQSVELVHRLRAVDGIAVAEMSHDQPRSVVIRYSDEDLADAGLTPPELADFIRANSQRFPGGYLTDSEQVFSLDLGVGVKDIETLRELPVRDPRDGSVTPLEEICEITTEPLGPDLGGAIWGQREAIGITFTKTASANWADVSNAVKAAIADFPKLDTKLVLYRGDVAGELLSASTRTLGFSAIAVLLCVTLCLGLRAGIAATVAIVTTILGSVFLLHLLGFELNVITLSALAVGTGLLIDNHIVITHHLGWLREGQIDCDPRKLAARDLLSPLLIAGATTVLGFFPAWLLRGEPAGYVSSLFVVIGVLLVVSQIIGFVVTPMLVPVGAKPNRLFQLFGKAIKALTKPLVRIPYVVAILLVAAVVFAGFLLKTGRESAFPEVPSNTFATDLIFLPGTAPEESAQVAKAIVAKSKDNVAFLHFPTPRILRGMDSFAPAGNRVSLIWDQPPGDDISFPENVLVRHKNISATPASGDPIRFRISGEELDAPAIRKHLEEGGATVFGFEGTEQSAFFEISPDLETAAELKVLTSEISISALAVTSGLPVGILPDPYDTASRLPVFLKVASDETDPEDRINEAYVHRQSGGNPVPLEDLAKVKKKLQPATISRWNGAKVAYLTADAKDTEGDPVAIEQALATSLASAFPKLDFEAVGDWAQSIQTKQKVLRHLIPVGVGILLLLIWQTGSVRTTFSILLTVAPAFLGAAAALQITGQPFGVMALLGTIALAGIVVNNAIVLADRLRVAKACSDAEILEIAAERLCPILLSATCAVFGLLPLMLLDNPLWKPFATVMIGGLVVATASTLLALPALWKLSGAKKLAKD